MTLITPEPPAAIRNRALPLAAILLLLAPLASHAYAQSPATKLADLSSANEKPSTYKTFYLTNLTREEDANEIQTDLRNMLPMAKLYYVPSQNALSMRASAEDIALAQKILADLDRTPKSIASPTPSPKPTAVSPPSNSTSLSSLHPAARPMSNRAARCLSSSASTRRAAPPARRCSIPGHRPRDRSHGQRLCRRPPSPKPHRAIQRGR